MAKDVGASTRGIGSVVTSEGMVETELQVQSKTQCGGSLVCPVWWVRWDSTLEGHTRAKSETSACPHHLECQCT